MSHETGQDRTARRLGLRIDYYATQHHLSVGAIRKRIQRGQLDAYKGPDHRWYVLGDVARDETGQDTRQDTRRDTTRHDATESPTSAVMVNPNARAQLEAIRDEWLAPLVAQITEQAERIGHLEAEREELRRRAEAAEAELSATRLAHEREVDELRAQAPPAPPHAASPPTTAIDTPAPQKPPEGLWARLRRVFGGGSRA